MASTLVPRPWRLIVPQRAVRRDVPWTGWELWWALQRWFARVSGDLPATGSAGSPSADHTDSFEAFFQRFGAEVFGYLWRMTGEEQTAYDLSQETFLRAWRSFARVRGYERPGAWLYRVATNLALNYLKHRGVASAVLTPMPDDPDDALAASGASQGDPLAALAEHDQVRAVLLDLAPRGRAALVLHDVCGLTSEEIARAIGIAPGAARMLLCRAREQFRARYLRQEARP